MKCFYTVLSTFLTFLLSPGCGPLPDIRSFSDVDLRPPVYLGLTAISAIKLELEFQEPVEPDEHLFFVVPTIPLIDISCTDHNILLEFEQKAYPGREYHLEGSVKDAAGNRLQFITKFYGFNSEIPDICINEFITRGSSSHPDVVELYVKTDGNIAGMCLYDGTPGNWSDKVVFPSLAVSAGDYIVVHFKPQGIPDEINEIFDKNESGGLDCSPSAWDFWIKQGDGLSGNNGVISLYASPSGRLIDGVLYSNRTSESDQTYRGFGQKDTMARADQLHEDGGWDTDYSLIAPEDGVNPEESTSTRSICRNSNSLDTNAKSDWHITPTRGSTFGSVNNDDVFVNTSKNNP